MAIETINNGESGKAVRDKINGNFGKSLNLDPTDGLQIGGAAPNAEQRAAVRAGMGAVSGGSAARFSLPVVEKFNRISDWTVTGSGVNGIVVSQKAGGGVFASDCINYQSPGTAGFNFNIQKTTNIDLTLRDGFWLYMRFNNRKPKTVGQGVTIYLSNEATIGGNYLSTTAYPSSGSVSEMAYWVPKTGFAATGTATFASKIKTIRIRVDTKAGSVNDVDLLGIVLGKKRPSVVVAFDDGWVSTYTDAWPEAQKRAVPLTHYLIGELFDNPLYITRENAMEFIASGDYVGFHGTDRWDTDLSQVDADYARLKAELPLAGDFEHASYPEGEIGDEQLWRQMIVKLQSLGCKSGRLAGLVGTPVLAGFNDNFTLSSYVLRDTTSLASAKAAVDEAIKSGGCVHFYGHKIEAVAGVISWAKSDFIALLDYICEKRDQDVLDVDTVSSWYDKYLL